MYLQVYVFLLVHGYSVVMACGQQTTLHNLPFDLMLLVIGERSGSGFSPAMSKFAGKKPLGKMPNFPHERAPMQK